MEAFFVKACTIRNPHRSLLLHGNRQQQFVVIQWMKRSYYHYYNISIKSLDCRRQRKLYNYYYRSHSLSSDNDKDNDNKKPWKTLLELPARASWRYSSKLPDIIEKSLNTTLDKGGRRNRKQLRRTFEQKIVTIQKELAKLRERQRQRIIENRIYNELEKKRDETIKPILYGPDEYYANLYFRFTSQYFIIHRILQETKNLLGSQFNPKRIIDFGIGSGSASVAAISIWGSNNNNNNNTIEWIHGIDPSQTMQDGSKYLLDQLIPTTTRTTFASHLTTTESSSSNFDLALFTYTACELPNIEAILTAAAILWDKINNNNNNNNGIFVMIEPGTPDGFHNIRMVRNMLLDVDPEQCTIIAPCTHNGTCPLEGYKRPQHYSSKQQQRSSTQQTIDNNNESDDDDDEDDESSSSDSDDDENLYDNNDDDDNENNDNDEVFSRQKGFCSFNHNISGNRKGEKFSYLVAQKRNNSNNNNDDNTSLKSHHHNRFFDNNNVRDLLERTQQARIIGNKNNNNNNKSIDSILLNEALDMEKQFLLKSENDDSLGLELLQGDDINRQSFGRIINAPKKNKGHVLIDTCVTPGKIVRTKITKSMTKQIPGIYNASRKSRWGGLWPDVPNMQDDK